MELSMRWTKKEKLRPENGETFDRWEFLYFNVTIGNETRWLERAHILYAYNPYSINFSKWEPIKFLNN